MLPPPAPALLELLLELLVPHMPPMPELELLELLIPPAPELELLELAIPPMPELALVELMALELTALELDVVTAPPVPLLGPLLHAPASSAAMPKEMQT